MHSPEKLAADAARVRAKRAELRAERDERDATCCTRKTDLIRGKGRLIEQCAKCGAMLDAGPEPEPIDRFVPVWG